MCLTVVCTGQTVRNTPGDYTLPVRLPTTRVTKRISTTRLNIDRPPFSFLGVGPEPSEDGEVAPSKQVSR